MQDVVTPWEKQGCDACRMAWARGGSEPLRLLGTNSAMHARIHQCALCRAYWEEGERSAWQVSEQEARSLLDEAEHVENVVYGDLRGSGLEVVVRDGRYFVRYDAGAHAVAWREDELTEQEFAAVKLGGEAEHKAILSMQRRLESAGIEPYRQNWTPRT